MKDSEKAYYDYFNINRIEAAYMALILLIKYGVNKNIDDLDNNIVEEISELYGLGHSEYISLRDLYIERKGKIPAK